jgi:hypothetical protein
VLDPLNNLNTPCALALFLGSMDTTTAKRLTRVRSYQYRLQFPVVRYLSPGQNVKRDHFLRLRSPALSGLCEVTCPLRQPEAASRAQSPGRESETERRSDKSRDSGRKLKHVCDHHDRRTNQCRDSIKVGTQHGGDLGQQNIARYCRRLCPSTCQAR